MEKGNDDGLYISSVACCQELWALIMDAGTGFSAQVPAVTCSAALCLISRMTPCAEWLPPHFLVATMSPW